MSPALLSPTNRCFATAYHLAKHRVHHIAHLIPHPFYSIPLLVACTTITSTILHTTLSRLSYHTDNTFIGHSRVARSSDLTLAMILRATSLPIYTGTSRPLPDIPLQLWVRTLFSLTSTINSTTLLPSQVRIDHKTTTLLAACAARGTASLCEHTQPHRAEPGSIGHPSPGATDGEENDTPHTPPPSSPSRLPSTLPPATRCGSRGNKSPHLRT
jgi:hypothetical protein